MGLHTYYAPIHARDIDHPQFSWTLQRYLYDCLHDYVVEMFTLTPQSRESQPVTPLGGDPRARRSSAAARSRFIGSWTRRSTIREHGYYRRQRDPFGKDGDFFTAEQLQPVFGILIAARIRSLYREMGEPSDFTVVELGPGRGEMAESLLRYELRNLIRRR